MPSERLLDDYWREQARVGAEASAASVAAWSRVNPLSLAESGSSWFAIVLAAIRGQRTHSRAVAAAFYRLNRALETGYTVPPLNAEIYGPTTLGDLREEWSRVTGSVRVPTAGDSDEVRVDDFVWPEEPEADFDNAARAALVSQGLSPVFEELSRADGESGRGRLDDPDFLAVLNDSMKNASTRAAMAADRETQRGGRDLIRKASQADTKVIGWARVTDGDPCGFCAMLASRGAVYRSRANAGIRGLDGDSLPEVHRPDLEKYHSGCHCQTVPVYNRTDFLTPEAERYAREWREVTRGTAGDEARRAWRRHIDRQRRSNRP